jgi:hypothetical protein
MRQCPCWIDELIADSDAGGVVTRTSIVVILHRINKVRPTSGMARYQENFDSPSALDCTAQKSKEKVYEDTLKIPIGFITSTYSHFSHFRVSSLK